MSPQVEIQRVLSDALTSARIRNPSYSLRAFARRLKIGPAALSEILNGKRRISKTMASKLVDRLSLDPVQSAKVLESFAGAGAPRDQKNGAASDATDDDLDDQKAAEYVELDARASLDHFAVVAEWQHFAILSLCETEDARADADWIADRLGLRTAVAREAVDRLVRLGLARRSGRKLVATGRQYSTPDEIASRAIRRAHAQFLELATRSLDDHSIEERDFTGITMAIDPERLPEAKRMVRKFRDRLSQYLEGGKKTEVYRFNAQLMPLSRPKKEFP